MDPQIYDRWLEVKFYYFCQDLMAHNGSTTDVMAIIEALAAVGKYEAEPVKSVAQEILTTYRIRPTREELILLCYKNSVPVRTIVKELQVSNLTLYNLIADDKEDPRAFYPRLDVHKLALIKKFFDALDVLRKVGF